MMHFQSLSSFEITGRGTVYVVENPTECHDFAHIIGHEVILNDRLRGPVIGVERFVHMPPWRKGEHIGLLISEQQPTKTHETKN